MSYRFEELNADVFETFARQHPLGNWLQSKGMGDLLQARGYTIHYLGMYADEQLVAATLLSYLPGRLGHVMLANGGYLLDYQNQTILSEFSRAVKNYAKQKGGLVLYVLPNLVLAKMTVDGEITEENDAVVKQLQSLGFRHEAFRPGYDGRFAPEWEYVKDLTDLSVDDVGKSYGSDARYYLKKNAQFGLELQTLTEADLPQFKSMTESSSERIGFTDKPLAYYQKAYEAFGDEVKFVLAKLNFDRFRAEQQHRATELTEQIQQLEQKIAAKPDHKKYQNQHRELTDQLAQHEKRIQQANDLQAEVDGAQSVPVAGAMFMIRPQELIYLYSGTNEDFKAFYGPYLIQDAMIKLAIEQQIPLYNFYGISGTFDGSDGVLKFKDNFNGYVRQKVGTFTQVLRPVRYYSSQLLHKLLRR